MYQHWDLPTRLFHWSLALLVFLSWLSYEEDYINVHINAGYGVATLLLFRLCWGVVGSVHSRFSNFVRRPGAVYRYLVDDDEILKQPVGHNPLGGWSVILMLILLMAQVTTGLFNTDELIYAGPLNHIVSASWADRFGEWHERLFWIICASIALHIVAVIYKQWRGSNLIWPMLDGGTDGQSDTRSSWLGLLVLLLVTGALALVLSLVPAPELIGY